MATKTMVRESSEASGVVKGPTESLVIEITKRRVADLLCSALEGGAIYWYQIDRFVAPKPENEESHTGSTETFRHIDWPLCVGGALYVSDKMSDVPAKGKVTRVKLDWPKIKEGLVVMASKYPRHFGDWLAENDDATTGDVFLQCCVFGEIVYG